MDDQNKNQEIEDLKNYIKTTEASLESARKALEDLTGVKTEVPKNNTPNVNSADKIVEGVFDGENMIGDAGKVYPVPANYASKSKLIVGDKLKLSVAEDGSFIFKQIGPAERRKIIGTLAFENNAYHVMAEGKVYKVLYASVTYYKAKNGDRVTLVIPAQGDADWAALDNVIHDVPEKEDFDEDIMSDNGDSFWTSQQGAGASVGAPVDTVSPVSIPDPVPPVQAANVPSEEPIPVAVAEPEAIKNPTPSPAQPQQATEMDI
jgi:hypothetical protein